MHRRSIVLLVTWFALLAGVAAAQGLPPGFQLPPGVTLPPGIDVEKLLKERGGKPTAAETAPQVVPVPVAVPAAPPPVVAAPTAGEAADRAPKVPEPTPPETQRVRDLLAEIRAASAPKADEDLPIFGFNLFDGTAPFQALQGAAVPDRYVLGPGDQVRVTVWGRFDAEYLLTVDNEGKAVFPKVGPVQLGGLTYAKAREKLVATAESITGLSASVAMGTTRTVQVFVVGEARKPGTHTLPPFSTVLHAVLAAGGPTPLGSLRRVELRRGGQATATLDLYGFVLRGEVEGDRPLNNGDVVVVHRANTKVWVQGKVKRPAVYELRSGEGLRTALAYAGGLQPDAFGGRLQVERADQNRARTVLDVALRDLGGDFTLQDGDTVRVFPLKPEIENRVGLFGHVFQPDTYAFTPGMRVSNLVRSLDALKPEAELSYAVILREEGPDRAKVTVPFHLGAALDGSDPAANLALKARDEVHVFSRYQFRPALRAKAEGELRDPGTYRYERGARVADLIRLAGGLTPDALLTRAELLRYLPDRSRALHPVDLGRALSGEAAHNLELQDEDTLIVHSLKGPVPELTVSAAGEVNRPGGFALTAGMRVADLVIRAGDLTKDAYREEAHVFRTDPRTKEVSFLRFHLAQALEGATEQNLRLQDQDRVVVYSARTLAIPRAVSVAGEVKKPDTYPLGEGMRVADLVLKAGGLTKDTHLGEAHLYRTQPQTKEVTIQVFALGKALGGDPAEDLLLQDGDRVVLHSAYEYAPAQKVYASGSINKPGEYPYATNMRVRDLVLVAAGLKEEAYRTEAEIVRSAVVDGEIVEVATIPVPLAQAMAGKPGANLELKPYDKLFVKRIREWREAATVVVDGEVQFPGTYAVAKGETLSSVLRRAGGYTPAAYLRGAVFTRESARVLQQKRFDELAERLQQSVLRASGEEAQAALTPEDLAAQKQYLAAQEILLKKLQTAKATGRVVLRLPALEQLPGSAWDVTLEHGDTLTVPPRPQTVAVVGSVYNPTSLLWDSGERRVSRYLALTGGPTPEADEKEIHVVRADGTVESTKSLKGASWWSRGIASLELDPGDSVLVPQRVIRPNYMRDVRDITQILYQIAVTAGVAVALF